MSKVSSFLLRQERIRTRKISFNLFKLNLTPKLNMKSVKKRNDNPTSIANRKYFGCYEIIFSVQNQKRIVFSAINFPEKFNSRQITLGMLCALMKVVTQIYAIQIPLQSARSLY